MPLLLLSLHACCLSPSLCLFLSDASAFITTPLLCPAWLPHARQRNLLDRLAALEEAYGQQMQRLKGYMPATAYSRLVGRLGPRAGLGSGGSVLQRLELLEEGMELLLRAQELAWQQAEDGRRRARCCGGCVIC